VLLSLTARQPTTASSQLLVTAASGMQQQVSLPRPLVLAGSVPAVEVRSRSFAGNLQRTHTVTPALDLVPDFQDARMPPR
jgi:hypothetical protein